MVIWITGRSGAGKTTLAGLLKSLMGGIVLDGEVVRHYFPCGFTSRGICKNHHNLTRIARILERQGFLVIIAVVSKDRDGRRYFQSQFNECVEIYMPEGTAWEGEYEEPETSDFDPVGYTIHVDQTSFQLNEPNSTRWIRDQICSRRWLVSGE